VQALPDAPVADPITALESQLSKARAKLADTVEQYLHSMKRKGALAEIAQTKLEGEYEGQRDVVSKLERQLAALNAAPAIDEVQKLITTLTGAALAGDVVARGKIADALPEVVQRVTCRRDGSIRLAWKGMTTITWTTTLDRRHLRPTVARLTYQRASPNGRTWGETRWNHLVGTHTHERYENGTN
jgi:hypothetical protein